MNWVVIIAGLIPFWAALFIAFSNMKVLNGEDLIVEASEPKKETLLELDLTEEKPEKEEKTGLFSGVLGRLKKKGETGELVEELALTDDPILKGEKVMAGGIELPKGIKRIWGAAMILLFLACLAYGSERALDYAFKEYRWVIGTTNPWTRQLEFNTMATTVLAALGVMVATLKTGMYLIRN